MAKKVVANGDEAATVLSPGTYRRHADTADYVLGAVRTSPPLPDRSRSPGANPGAWGLLASGGTITACSGITLGTGSVDLCDSSGTAYDPVETVNVKNAGGVISAGVNTILPLEWTGGDWSVCGCVEDGVVCSPCSVPRKNLTVSAAGGLPLTYYPAGTLGDGAMWVFGDITFNGFYYLFQCLEGLLNFQQFDGTTLYEFTFVDCTGGPFHAHFHDPIFGDMYVDE